MMADQDRDLLEVNWTSGRNTDNTVFQKKKKKIKVFFSFVSEKTEICMFFIKGHCKHDDGEYCSSRV